MMELSGARRRTLRPNAAMLAINMKLGFKREIGWIAFAKNTGKF